jgi:uncharacterized phiE125 gp8 family phage protein
MAALPRVEIVTPPAAEPVTVAEFKSHLRLDWDDEDAQLPGFITAARQVFERRAGRAVLPTVVREAVAGWPCSRRLPLTAAPVLSVQSVTYRDPLDAEQTLAGWRADVPAEYGTLVFPDALALPRLSADRTHPVSVTYTAGWADPAAVPAVVKAAVRLLAAHYYAVREEYTPAEVKLVPMGFGHIVDMYWTGLNWGA